jgi:hypothetical protein
MMQFINKPMAFGPQIITGSPLLSGEVGFAYATGLNSINGAPPYTYAVVSGALPPGLSIVGAAIVGTPTTIGNPYSFALVATDSHGAKSNPAGFSLTVVSMLVITTASPLPTATQGTPYATTLAASWGVSPYTWAEVAGSLDPGLSLNTATGAITGTPTTPAIYTPTFQVTDSLNYEVQKSFSLTVNTNYVAPTITTTSPLTSATNGVAYSFQMQAINGTTPYTWTLTSQTGSNGWAVSASGLVTGTPATNETDTLNIKLVDAHPTTVGPQAFTITVSAAAPTGQYKFNPGDYMSSENDEAGTNTAQWKTEIGVFQGTQAGMQGYRVTKRWSDLENFNATSNGALAAGGLTGAVLQTAINAQYTGFADVEACFYYLQALCPGKRLMIYLNHHIISGSSFTSSYISTNNFITSPEVVPAWMANGGVADSGSAGTLKIPDFYGASTTGLYSGPVDVFYSGSPYYCMAFNGYNSGNNTLQYAVPRFWNPPERQAMVQLVQAFFLRTLTAGSAYNAGTPYTPGNVVTNGGVNYLCIANTTGNAPPNASFWVVNAYAGQTFDTCPLFEMSGTNMEYSFDFTVNTNIPGCPYQNPPHFSAGVQATRASGIAGTKSLFKAWCAASPHTVVDTCFSYSFNVQSPYDTPVTMGQHTNSLIPGGEVDALNTITGLALGNSNHYGLDFFGGTGSTNYYANGPAQAYYGIDVPTSSPTALPAPNAAHSLIGKMPCVTQHQEEDYWQHLPGGVTGSTTAAVNSLITDDAVYGSNWRIWNITTSDVVAYPPSGYPASAMWVNTTYPALQANATKASTTVPANLPVHSWKTLPVGGGGYVRGLIIAADGTMVGRTDTAGAYLYNGTSWNQLITVGSMPAAFVTANFNAGLGGCYEIAIAPSNTQIFYMAYANLMFRSANQGTTWTQVASIGNSNPNDGNSQIGQKMAVDPNNANIVYAGVDGGGLFVTINGGTSWSAVAGVPAGTLAGISGIVFGPASNQIGNVTQVIYACRFGTGVYFSTNGGTSWALTSGGPGSVINAQIDTSGNYWCAGAAGATVAGTNIYKYTASGATWANLTAGGGNGMQAVSVNPFNNSEIVGTDQSGHITFSSNGGATWTGINTNSALVSTDIPWLGPTSTVGGTGNNFFLTTGNCIFSSLTNGLLYQSSGVGVWSMNVPPAMTINTAITWNDLSVGIENLEVTEINVPPGMGPVTSVWDRSTFFLTPGTYPSGYLPVTDGGIVAAWANDYASSDPTYVCAIGNTFNGSFPANTSGFSHNNGASWTYFSGSIVVGGNPRGGCIAASTPNNILIAPPSVAPSYTLDGGNTWTQISIAGIASWNGFMKIEPAATWRKMCADRVTANTFYLYFPGSGVYISSNGGASWTQQKSGYIETNSAYANVSAPQMKAVPGNAGQLFYTSGPNQYNGATQTSPLTDYYFFRSVNGGTTWTQVANVLMVSAFGFGMAKPGGGGYPAIFINGFVNGVWGLWRSDDNGATWNNIGTFAGPNGLGTVVTMSGDMNTYGTCYLGLGGDGAGGYGAGAGYAYYG